MKTCFLFGHRDTPQDLQPAIEKAIERHYLHCGVRQFYVGGYGGFDRMAGAAVKAVKKKYGDISLYLLLPYHPAERPVEAPEGFDGTYYPPLQKVPRRYAIVRANRHMIETADTVICYVMHIGNTRNLLDYAEKRMERGLCYVENLGEAGLHFAGGSAGTGGLGL